MWHRAMIDKRLSEYDGKVPWNLFQAQFEIVTRYRGTGAEGISYGHKEFTDMLAKDSFVDALADK